MRNLIEHPINDQEIVECLKRAAEKLQTDQGVGDMDALLILTAADIIAGPTKCNHYTLIDNLVRINAKLRKVAEAARMCVQDDRGGPAGPETDQVHYLMGGHRRIRLADALKALDA